MNPILSFARFVGTFPMNQVCRIRYSFTKERKLMSEANQRSQSQWEMYRLNLVAGGAIVGFAVKMPRNFEHALLVLPVFSLLLFLYWVHHGFVIRLQAKEYVPRKLDTWELLILQRKIVSRASCPRVPRPSRSRKRRFFEGKMPSIRAGGTPATRKIPIFRCSTKERDNTADYTWKFRGISRSCNEPLHKKSI
jgi:hypothetical protein